MVLIKAVDSIAEQARGYAVQTVSQQIITAKAEKKSPQNLFGWF